MERHKWFVHRESVGDPRDWREYKGPETASFPDEESALKHANWMIMTIEGLEEVQIMKVVKTLKRTVETKIVEE